MSSSNNPSSCSARLHVMWLTFCRRDLNPSTRPSVWPSGLDELEVDPDRPVFLVRDHHRLSSLLITDQTCRDLDWPRPAAPFTARGANLTRSWCSSRRDTGVFSRRRKSRYPHMLTRLIDESHPARLASVQLVPVTVVVGRTADKEKSL